MKKSKKRILTILLTLLGISTVGILPIALTSCFNDEATQLNPINKNEHTNKDDLDNGTSNKENASTNTNNKDQIDKSNPSKGITDNDNKDKKPNITTNNHSKNNSSDDNKINNPSSNDKDKVGNNSSDNNVSSINEKIDVEPLNKNIVVNRNQNIVLKFKWKSNLDINKYKFSLLENNKDSISTNYEVKNNVISFNVKVPLNVDKLSYFLSISNGDKKLSLASINVSVLEPKVNQLSALKLNYSTNHQLIGISTMPNLIINAPNGISPDYVWKIENQIVPSTSMNDNTQSLLEKNFSTFVNKSIQLFAKYNGMENLIPISQPISLIPSLLSNYSNENIRNSFIWLSGIPNQEADWYLPFGGIGFNPNTMKVTWNLYKDPTLTPQYATRESIPNKDYNQNLNRNQVFYKTKKNFNLFNLALLDSSGNKLHEIIVNTDTNMSLAFEEVNSWFYNYGDRFQITFNNLSKGYPFSFMQSINVVNNMDPILPNPAGNVNQKLGYFKLEFTITKNGLTNPTEILYSNYGTQWQTTQNIPNNKSIPINDYKYSSGFADISKGYMPNFVASTFLNSFNVNPNGSPIPFTSSTSLEGVKKFFTLSSKTYKKVKPIVDKICSENWGNDIAIAKKILDYVYKSIHYKESRAGWYNADQTIENNSGVCFNKALVYAELMSMAGFTCDIVDGAAFSKPNNYVSFQGYHSWNMVYLPNEQKWVNVDPTWNLFNFSTTSGKFNRSNQFIAATFWNPSTKNYYYQFNNNDTSTNTNNQAPLYMLGGLFNQYFNHYETLDKNALKYLSEVFSKM